MENNGRKRASSPLPPGFHGEIGIHLSFVSDLVTKLNFYKTNKFDRPLQYESNSKNIF